METSISMIESFDDIPEYIIDSQETVTVTAVNDAIQSLDPIMRQVIHLRYFEEMKVKNIALLSLREQ
ncbi:Sigma-70, region 4 [Desulforamulus putei DSM 12395]|uniref:Sigma-70, region 4 n=1 Tax=Desulforamulus putei DSM 12395 TaxID=1121429 RepID=A0A1M4WFZ6_9FIRM|nr:Sigma-70, region 4 [Desulforamulus putei DSM 12395]